MKMTGEIKNTWKTERATLPFWFKKLLVALILGGLTAWWAIPSALQQRGSATLGGECILILVAFLLPLCIPRRR